MMVLGKLDGEFSRFALWRLGPGKPRLHFREERIDVETVGDIKRELEARGVTDVRVSGNTWEFIDEASDA